MREICIGTSGYNYGSWKETFYPIGLPSREWLHYFSSQFKTVEINNSFYVSTRKETYEKWYTQTPSSFRFVIKGHRMITQYKKLLHVEEEVKQFFTNAAGLKEKLSAVLWQFPASFKLSGERKEEYLERLQTFLQLIPTDTRHAFEFRDASWFVSDIFDLMHEHNEALVYSDSPSFPMLPNIKQRFSYIRFHGPGKLYATKYTTEQLASWAEKMKKFQKFGDVYAYFNNDIFGNAIENARELEKLVKHIA